MKLLIDIQDFVYNHIKEFNSTQLYELNVIEAIKNGTPLEEEGYITTIERRKKNMPCYPFD